MNRTIILLLLCITVTAGTVAQKLGKFDISLLSATSHQDSTASAAYIQNHCKISFVFNSNKISLVSEFSKRIKVYSENGEKYATISIPLYQQGSRKERITNIKGTTYNLVDGKVTEDKLKRKKDVFEEETSENWKQVKFAMPNVKAGSVVDIQYRVTSPFIYQLDRWFFQHEIPVDKSIYKLIIPSYFVYTPVPAGFHPTETKTKDYAGSVHGEVETTFTSVNIPAFKDDEYILNADDYKASIKYELYSITYPNNPPEYYSKDWNAIGKDLLESDRFGKEIKKKIKDPELSALLASVAQLPEEEKIKAIYDYVRETYTWNEKYGVGKDVGHKKLIETKTGNIGDINLLLINLLKKAGVNAVPAVTKSRYRGLLNESFPTLTELNYVVAYLPDPEGTAMALDASSKQVPFGQLPTRAINLTGVAIFGNGSQVIHLQNPNTYKSSTVSNYDLNIDEATLVGTSNRKKSDYAATKYRLDLENVDQSTKTEDDTEEEDDSDEEEELDIQNESTLIKAENIKELDQPIKLEYEEIIRDEVKQIGDSYFVNAAVDFGIDKNPFTEDTRKYPVFYNYKIDTKSIVNIQFPEDYAVESVPETVLATTPNKTASFRYEVKAFDKFLTIYYFIKVNQDIFTHTDYEGLKNLYDLIIDTQAEKIVISKK